MASHRTQRNKRKTPRYVELLNDARDILILIELFNYECGRASGSTYYLPYQVKELRARIRKPLKAIRRIERHYQQMVNLSKERKVRHG